jgi:hypothetical protein
MTPNTTMRPAAMVTTVTLAGIALVFANDGSVVGLAEGAGAETGVTKVAKRKLVTVEPTVWFAQGPDELNFTPFAPAGGLVALK